MVGSGVRRPKFGVSPGRLRDLSRAFGKMSFDAECPTQDSRHISGEMTERPIVRHWKCRVLRNRDRGFESPSLRLSACFAVFRLIPREFLLNCL